jgi:DNA replication protein DnaC
MGCRGIGGARFRRATHTLQIARRELALEAAITKLDKYHLLILDDLAYVTKDRRGGSPSQPD